MGNWEGTHLYKIPLEISAAEDFYVNHGVHLATFGSQEEQDELIEVTKYGESDHWLGGRRMGERWQWLDGRPWNFQNFIS